MKTLFAKYEHAKVGFPKVKLKFHEDAEKGVGFREPYLTVKGVIKEWHWSLLGNKPKESIITSTDFEKEIARFEKWVVDNFADDASVQG